MGLLIDTGSGDSILWVYWFNFNIIIDDKPCLVQIYHHFFRITTLLHWNVLSQNVVKIYTTFWHSYNDNCNHVSINAKM